jgi:hypothetical protein
MDKSGTIDDETRNDGIALRRPNQAIDRFPIGSVATILKNKKFFKNFLPILGETPILKNQHIDSQESTC